VFVRRVRARGALGLGERLIRLTHARRVAIAENMRVIALLSRDFPPRPYELGQLVLARVQQIAGGAEVWIASDADVESMAALAREFEGEAIPGKRTGTN
jgi:hypothetical protein